MSKRIKSLFIMCAFIFFPVQISLALELLEDGKIIIPDPTTESIKIDGELNETIWKKSPVSGDFHSFAPLYGETLGQQTSFWMSYDDRCLYFAFKCYDTEPHKIKTSIAKRDTIARDDWVGVVIDTMENRQTSYEFYVNPDGIQEDAYTSAVNGWSYDNSPDFVWKSAGKKVDNGYQVEFSVPLESIRFKSGKDVRMGMIFLRNISRLGKTGSWPEIKAGQTQFNAMADVIYSGLKNKLKLELLPNVVYGRNVERENGGAWGESDTSTNMGISVKYGITSSMTTEATINPDFSQVESDAFQVLENQRYPIFYSEKRPFFMEGMDVFDFGLISQGMMTSAVHTRNIVDPDWAAKLSGTTGKIAFNVLAANDKAPGEPWTDEVNPHEGKHAIWGIARAKYTLGSDNSLGVLYSGRYFAGGKNNVLGADLQYRFFKNARLKMSYLYSNTREPETQENQTGNGLNAMLEYSSRLIDTFAAYEHYSRDFLMYSAFQNRTAINRGIVYAGPNFYISSPKIKWIQKIQPHIQYSRLYDYGTRMYDTNWLIGVDTFFIQGGFIKVEARREKEAWLGHLFKQDYFYATGNVQLFNWLFLQATFRLGDQIYYDLVEPQTCNGNNVILRSIIQPDVRLNLDLQYQRTTLSRKSDGKQLYSNDIINVLAAYQFNKYFFIRASLRYDDYQEKLFTDFLASFTLIPGTVIHLGYSSLYEKKAWMNNQWISNQDRFLNMKNGLFFKVSYLWRLK